MSTPARLGRGAVAILCACLASCSSPTPAPISDVGNWSGVTAQGGLIFFVISPDERVTHITADYTVDICHGSQTFSNLGVPITEETHGFTTTRGFSFQAPGTNDHPVIELEAVLQPGRASGTLNFRDHPHPQCGSALDVQWSATKR